ncbi:hypothetical protein [Desulfosporosinus sp. SB140]|uniref:hypothetical protein n=1 Tax=Desulfosporosinus paludis TaxID=3115649 RepID=UPI00388D021A
MKDNPNKIWVVLRAIGARNPEYYQYNSVAEALSDFDDWTFDTESVVGCEVLYRGITLMHSSKGKISGALCEQYHPDCTVRGKLPNSQEITNCEECVTKLMADYVE